MFAIRARVVLSIPTQPACLVRGKAQSVEMRQGLVERGANLNLRGRCACDEAE